MHRSGSFDAHQHRARKLLDGLDCLVVQDLFLTATARMADVVFPATVAGVESEGTVTNSERRVQRIRKAVEPPGDARDDLWIIAELAKRLGREARLHVLENYESGSCVRRLAQFFEEFVPGGAAAAPQ